MQLRHIKPIMPATEGMCKVTALAWSPNNRRLAVVTVDRVVHLFDENGERRDKFSTKPADKAGPKTYLVTAMAFSPDSSKLAVAQSDNIVFVYKLGLEWGDKKSICNKFLQSSGITTLAWPAQHPNEVVFGLEEGKVKIGQLRTNKPATLYPTDSYVVSMASSPDGHGVLSGHLDGSIYRFSFEDGSGGPSHSKFAHHSCVPYGLSWGQSVLAAGNDSRVTFYDAAGALLRTFDYSGEPKVKEFTSAAFNPSGESVVVGNFNRFYVYNLNQRTGDWDEVGTKDIENLYTVTALSWKCDGSRLATGSLCGVVDLYDACIKRTRYKGKFEFTYVSLSQVIVKRLSSGTRIVLKSHFGCEIMKINIFQDRYLIAHTPETLLMGDLETCKLSEVSWSGSGKERFFFDNAAVCMVFNAGELSLVEYGRNELLGSCRTEYMNPHLISVRINERPPPRTDDDLRFGPSTDDNKKIAYLLDVQTIRVLDLVTGITCATVNHDARVDWLELNGRGTLVLFRDKRRKLHLYDIQRQERSTLLNYCNYVQWVPMSDVVVAQNRNNLCVWYNIHAPDKVTTYQIKGDVEEIERSGGKTEVVVDEGINTASYLLDEGLIGFGTAIEDRNLEQAMAILEPLDMAEETEAMWQQLASMALKTGDLHIAQRCAAALGDVSKARFLYKTAKLAADAEKKVGGDGRDYWLVRARMAQLRGDLAGAEAVYVEQGKVDDAIEMYQSLHRWDEAIRVAETTGHAQAADMRRQYFQYLLESGQEEKAAESKEHEGDFSAAINLYLKGGYPAKAASVVLARPSSYGPDVMEKVASSLSAAGMHDKAGNLFERMNDHGRALDAYEKGHAFRSAVELARRHFPAQVVRLEQAWGDWLVSQQQVDAAINHYIEAGASVAAINAALDARQFSKAVQLVEDTLRDPEAARPFYKRIARHFHEAGNLEEAERFYVKSGNPQAAVEMYTLAGRWESAHNVAVSCMSEAEVSRLYTEQAHKLEVDGKFKEAERLYLTVDEADLAINMYKKANQFDQMIRLVGTYRKDLLKDTHLHLAQQLEMKSDLKEAEHHYAEAGEWESAVNMYRSNDMWDEAFRVAKFHGGNAAANRVAYAWALSLGGEAGSKLLNKLGLIEQAVDYAIDSGAFDHAFQLARSSLKKKLPEVYLKHALFLEDEGRFAEAEAEFLAADKPKEAIDMYIHQQDWVAAMRVAEAYDPSSISDVLVAQGRTALEAKDYMRAESLFVDAKKPDLALRMYLDSRQFPEAIRVAKKHLPHKVHEVNNEIQRIISGGDEPEGKHAGGASGGAGGGENPLKTARMWESSRDWSLAINTYLTVAKEHVSSREELADAWGRAVHLAATYEKRRHAGVAEDVAQRFLDIGLYVKAAELFKVTEQHKEVVDAYMKGSNFPAAKDYARTTAAHLSSYVDQQHKKHLSEAGDAGSLEETGAVGDALAIYASKGEWAKVFEMANKLGGGAPAKYFPQYVMAELDSGNVVRIISNFKAAGAPVVPSKVDLYERIVRGVFEGSVDSAPGPEVIADARDVFYRLLASMRRSGGADNAVIKEVERLLLVLHYASLRSTAQTAGALDIAARLNVALVRYAGIVPADRAFYEAGMACRERNWLSMAFVFLNRYLDLSEAIDDGDISMVDNSDFVGTDIPTPMEFGLPKNHWLDEDRREEIRDWVLALSMDRQVEQVLNTIPCDNGMGKMYEASLLGPGDASYPPCVASGYPVFPAAQVRCTSCNSFAQKSSWNALVGRTKVCPWCAAAQNPFY